MIKMVIITKYKCEKCNSIVNSSDKFCSECGNNLTENITYEEDMEQIQRNRDDYFRISGIAP